jgi:eukaryotic-like serine/threonine-protein kinase
LKGALAIAIIVLLSLSMLSAFPPKIVAQQSPEDWPMFRADPSHSGKGTGNPALTPTLLWSYTTMGGGGNVSSSLTVANGVVYIGSMQGNIYALNVANGAKLWSYTTYSAVEKSLTVANGVVYAGCNDGKIYALNAANGAKLWSYNTDLYVWSSPAVVNGVVYVASDKVYALNAVNGAKLWSYTTGSAVETSPAVVNGVVYVGSSDGNVYALNAANGAKLWSYTTGSSTYSPAVVGGVVYVGTWGGNVYALNAANGAPIWNFTTGNTAFWSSPTVVNGLVYIDSDNSFVYALNTANGSPIWSYNTCTLVESFSEPASSPAVVNGVVYIGSQDGNVYALNAANGAKLWSYTTGGDVETSPAVVNGAVYIGSQDGNVYALNAANGAKLWSYTTGALVFSSPAVADGTVYVGSAGGMYAFKADSGTKIWNYTPSRQVYSSPAVANGAVYIGCDDGNVYALNAANGAKLWSYTTGSAVESSPAVVDGVVYIGSFDGNVYALNAANGAKLWSYTTEGGIFSSPAVVNGAVYIGCNDGNIYALNAANGAKLWSYNTGTLYLYSSPAVANGAVYIGSNDGYVYALNVTNGAKIWSYNTESWIGASPAVVNDVVYIDAIGGNVYALNAANGAKLWSYNTGTLYLYSSPAVANGAVYIGCDDGNVYALNAANGAKLWSYNIGLYVWSSPAVVDGVVYIGSFDGNVYALGGAPSTFDFTISTSGNLFSVDNGGTASVPISVSLVSGSAQPVSLSVAWIPAGSNQWFTTSFSVTSGNPSFNSVLTITPSNIMPSGAYTAQILASAGGEVRSQTVTIAVNPTVTFNETGLPLGSQWSVTVNGQIVYSTSNSIGFSVPKGIYHFTVNAPQGYMAVSSIFDVGVNGKVNGNVPTTKVIFVPNANSYKFATWDPAYNSYNVPNFETNFAGVTENGNCLGISSTAILYFNHYILGDETYPNFPSQNPQALSTSDLNLPTMLPVDPLPLNNPSLAIMFHQIYSPEQSSFYTFLSKLPSLLTPVNDWNNLKPLLDQGKPAMLTMWNPYGFQGSHAVVAFGYAKLADGSYAIALYDNNYPETTQIAICNPPPLGGTVGGSFSYIGYNSFLAYNPSIITPLWFLLNLGNQQFKNNWLQLSVNDYTIVVTDKMANITSKNQKDYFKVPGNSTTFVCGIPGTCGIEEGNIQVYAIPDTISTWTVDPIANESMLFFSHVSNDSGQLSGYGYAVNMTATQGILNYNATPSSNGLLISGGSGAFTADVTFFSGTEKDYSKSSTLSVPVAAGQNINLTVSDWSRLNSTGIQLASTYTVTFAETGLPSGLQWNVTFGGSQYYSNSSTIIIDGASAMSYPWSISTPLSDSTGTQYIASQAVGTIDVPSQTTQSITYTISSPPPTASPTPTPTPTATPTPSPTPTPTPIPTEAPTPTPTPTEAPTPTPTPTPIPTPIPTQIPSLTPTLTPNSTPTQSPATSPTATPTYSTSPTISPNQTSTTTASPINSAPTTPTITSTPTLAPTATPYSSQNPTPSPTIPETTQTTTILLVIAATLIGITTLIVKKAIKTKKQHKRF